MKIDKKEYNKVTESLNNFAKRKLFGLLKEYQKLGYGSYEECYFLNEMDIVKSASKELIIVQNATRASEEIVQEMKSFDSRFMQEKGVKTMFELFGSGFYKEYKKRKEEFLFSKYKVGSMYFGLHIEKHKDVDREQENLRELSEKGFVDLLSKRDIDSEEIKKIINLFLNGEKPKESLNEEYFDPMLSDIIDEFDM